MSKSLSLQFVAKAEAAMVSAVEIYNKPTFGYREETFSLLMLNAWELLLKGKLLADNANDVKAIRAYESRQNRDGTKSKKKYIRRNRSGNPTTLGLHKCISKLNSSKKKPISRNVESNLEALVEIRDNAAHYVMVNSTLVKQVLEIATASIQNFILLEKDWFSRDLSDSLSLMLPLSFIGGVSESEVVPTSNSEKNLIKYIMALWQESNEKSGSDQFHFAVKLDVSIERSKIDTASLISVSNDPKAIPISLSEEDIRKKYPWDYQELKDRLYKRYSDFKLNNRFHELRRPLLNDTRYAYERYLNPGNIRSGTKMFYNSNILKEFDKHYSKK